MRENAFHPDTQAMLRAVEGLHEPVRPDGIARFEALTSRLFTARFFDGRLVMEQCGREARGLLGADCIGRDLLARFPSPDRTALRALLVLAREAESPAVAQVRARTRRGQGPIEAELVLAPLHVRDSAALLGFAQRIGPQTLGAALELRVLRLHAPQPQRRGAERLRLVAQGD